VLAAEGVSEEAEVEESEELEEIHEQENETDDSSRGATLAFAPAVLAVIGEPTHHSKFVAFQTPSSPIMEGIIDLHHDIMFFLVFVIVFVMYLMAVIMVSSKAKAVSIESEAGMTEKGVKAATITPFIVSSHNTALEII